ncbi:MAG: penicillin-binding transpeptidase domain-containing protein [Bdellovibrio sp.]|jgi:peptidoglycan glycosyltransferase
MFPWVMMACIWWWLGSDEREIKQLEISETKKVSEISEVRGRLAKELGPFFLHSQFPEKTEMSWGGKTKNVQIDYSIDADLQKEADRLLKSYRPDYGSVVVMDALTGRVLAISTFQKGDPLAPNLALRGTFPAASIFKIVTATAAVDKYSLSPETIVMFNGGNYTLYKKNVMEAKRNRWSRDMTIREAFARSINTVFGRLTLEHLQPGDLEEYAVRFGFNKKIESDLPFDTGFTEIPHEKAYHLTEIASGFNRVTTMSPLQGAMIAASVAGSGKMMVPTIVDRIRDDNGDILYQSEPVTAAVTMTPEGAERLKKMMGSTISRGTSSKAFRPLMRDKKFRELELGGKTGSLTGDNPRGKVDWFVGYAIGGADSRLAIAAITVNVKNWTVKSSHLAQSLFRKHYKDQFSERNEKFFNASNHNNED